MRLTSVARRATPPLPPQVLSLSLTGSICECVSLVCRIVTSTSPAATSSSGSARADQSSGEIKLDGTAKPAPVISELFKKRRRLIIDGPPQDWELPLYSSRN